MRMMERIRLIKDDINSDICNNELQLCEINNSRIKNLLTEELYWTYRCAFK